MEREEIMKDLLKAYADQAKNNDNLLKTQGEMLELTKRMRDLAIGRVNFLESVIKEFCDYGTVSADNVKYFQDKMRAII